MAGAYCKPWCIYCRRKSGIDCSDRGRDTKWRRRIDKESLRRYTIRDMEDEMSWKVPPVIAERRAMAEKGGYEATIRPWSGGWEILHIHGFGVEDGATQACTLDEVEHMVRDYVCCTLDLDPDDTPDDEWDESGIPVRLTLDLEPRQHTGSKIAVKEVHDQLNGQRATLIEETTWWLESPEAE